MKTTSRRLLNFERKFKKTLLSEDFHQSTKVEKVNKVSDLKDRPRSWVDIDFKGYPRYQSYLLPRNYSQKIKKQYLTILKNRKSSRVYDNSKTMYLQTISTLLYFSAGVREKIDGNWNNSTRFYPSAGKRYPLETYVIIIGKTDIPKGIYHYYVKSHSLEILKEGDFTNEVYNCLNNRSMVKSATMVIFITAIFQRNQIEYGNRGYRQIFIENGALAQTIYLNSSALDLNCCMYSGYHDDKVNELLDLDGEIESAVNTILIGNPKR